MGYTNYWDQPTNFTDQEWNAVREEFEYIRGIAQDKIDVEETSDCIEFNGSRSSRGGGCETFVLFKEVPTKKRYPEQKLEFNYCKTRGSEYDIYVWHLLTFCQMIKKDFVASRDGWSYEKINKIGE
tara:strand:+ start:3751 stop:4128 length:378 start_codon:yes stop_codon:yes gene_type:complete